MTRTEKNREKRELKLMEESAENIAKLTVAHINIEVARLKKSGKTPSTQWVLEETISRLQRLV